ncbi:hypothetical protein JXM67_11930 [candidate division WOR-3 bacterium]|nr:hypothetical protein [candidate division WOR-3 bacterium]
MKRLSVICLFPLVLGLGCSKPMTREKYHNIMREITIGSYSDIDYDFIFLSERQLKRVKEICGGYDVSFLEFNRAHKRYGRLGLSYPKELLSYYVAIKKRGYGDRLIYSILSDIEFMDDEWIDLLIDLGFHGFRDPFMLVEYKSDGSVYMYGYKLEPEEMYLEIEEIIKTHEYGLAFHFYADDGVTAGDMFGFFSEMPAIIRNVLSYKFERFFFARVWPWDNPRQLRDALKNHTWEKYFKTRVDYREPRVIELPVYASSKDDEEYELVEVEYVVDTTSKVVKEEVRKDTLPDVEFPGIKFIVKIKSPDEIYFNSKPVDSLDELDSLSREYENPEWRTVLVAIDEGVSWNQAMDIVSVLTVYDPSREDYYDYMPYGRHSIIIAPLGILD